MPPFDTPDVNNAADLFDMTSDFSDIMDANQPVSQQQQQQQPSSSTNQQANIYQQPPPQQQQQQQQRINYIPQPRSQLPSYQTPSLQRIPTMPTSTIVRSTNVISNGMPQQQSTIYTPQQMINTSRTVYPRMPTGQPQSNMSSTLVRQQYNPTGMVQMNQTVTPMNIVKASDPNNNHLFVTNSQQASTLVGLQPQHAVTQTVQANKPMPTGLPSLTTQQLNQYQIQQLTPSPQIHMQQQNSLASYNIRVCYKFYYPETLEVLL